MRRLSDFADSLFFIGLGIFVIVVTRNPSELNEGNSRKVEGILREHPKEGVHDESKNYIGLRFNDCNDFFEFSGCSYNNEIKENVKKLVPGNKVILYVSREGSSITYPWKGKKYKTFIVYEAHSPDYGDFINFDQYNKCTVRKANILIPVLCGISIFLGLFRFVKKWNDKNNIMDRKYLDLSSIEELKIQDTFKLKPDKLTYILRNSGLPILCFIFGLILELPFNSDPPNIFDNIFILLGVFILAYYILNQDSVYYIFDNDGVHIRNISIFFQIEIVTIPYRSIKEVNVMQASYEVNRNVGTIKIHDGEIYDGEKMYETLAGIKEYEVIAKLIRKRADVNS